MYTPNPVVHSNHGALEQVREIRKWGSRMELHVAQQHRNDEFLCLVLLSLVESLVDKGVLSEEELNEKLAAVDAADGEIDGQTDLKRLRRKVAAKRPGASRTVRSSRPGIKWRKNQSRNTQKSSDRR